MTSLATCAYGTAPAPPFTPDAKSSTFIVMTAQRSSSSRPENKGGMNALARLIKRRKEELDLTWQELADRGGFTSHTVVYALANKSIHKSPPRAETLDRLAKALSVPVDVVRAAAMEAAGYRVEEISTTLEASEDVRIIAAVAGDLPAEDRAVLRGIAEQFAKRLREQHKE